MKEARKDLLHTVQQPGIIRGLIYFLSNIGGGLVLRELRKFARERGFDIQKALDPP